MWTEGRLFVNGQVFTYCVKHFDEPSEYGIGGNGRISKLEVRLDGDAVMARYERGWDVAPEDKDAKAALEFLMKKYN